MIFLGARRCGHGERESTKGQHGRRARSLELGSASLWAPLGDTTSLEPRVQNGVCPGRKIWRPGARTLYSGMLPPLAPPMPFRPVELTERAPSPEGLFAPPRIPEHFATPFSRCLKMQPRLGMAYSKFLKC